MAEFASYMYRTGAGHIWPMGCSFWMLDLDLKLPVTISPRDVDFSWFLNLCLSSHFY